MDEYQKGVLHGAVAAIIFTVVLWFVVASEVEEAKVNKGYLTWQRRTYSVVLYDTLEKPEKGATDVANEREHP